MSPPRGRRRRAAGVAPRTGGSLAALLHEAADELLGVRLEHPVDLVEDAVDVVGQPLLDGGAGRRSGWRLRGLRRLLVTTLRLDVLLTRHGYLPDVKDLVPRP